MLISLLGEMKDCFCRVPNTILSDDKEKEENNVQQDNKKRKWS